jgi:hypothetical protein
MRPQHGYYKDIQRLRTPLFARHSRQFTTHTNVLSESGDRSRWR